MRIFNEDYLYNNILCMNKNRVLKELEAKEGSYSQFRIPKKSGTRTISAINKTSNLYGLQCNLYNNFFSKIPVPSCVKGFVKRSGYLEYLFDHTVDSPDSFFLRIDIKDFFDTITSDLIKSCLSEYIGLEEEIKIIVDICTLNDKLPQGAVTSPSLSNLVMRRLDQRITLYCQCLNITYTRYADDLLFSSEVFNFYERKWFVKRIKDILAVCNFKINYNKIKFGKEEIAFNGYVINENINLSRKKLHNLTTILYYFNKNKGQFDKKYRVDGQLFIDPQWLAKLNTFLLANTNIQFIDANKLRDYFIGYRAFLISCFPYACETKREQYSKKIKHIEDVVEKINQYFYLK